MVGSLFNLQQYVSYELHTILLDSPREILLALSRQYQVLPCPLRDTRDNFGRSNPPQWYHIGNHFSSPMIKSLPVFLSRRSATMEHKEPSSLCCMKNCCVGLIFIQVRQDSVSNTTPALSKS
jgi:hypothetical protein